MISNMEYVEGLVEKNELIIIDTSSLMEYESFARFITKYESLFAESGRKILVPEAVYLELNKLILVGGREKTGKAYDAKTLLKTYEGLFDIEIADGFTEKIMGAFADPELLIRLSEGRSKYRQLLITNDRNLASDAFKLNDLASSKGHLVSVCYINSAGELHRCECTKQKEELEQETKESEPKVVERIVYRDAPAEKKGLSGLGVAAAVGAMIVSFAAGIGCERVNRNRC